MLANDTDVEGGPITIASVSEPANGTVGHRPAAAPGSPTNPTPTTATPSPAATPDTFTYTLNGGDDADRVGDRHLCRRPAVAVNDTATVVEDAAATAIAVLANDTDVDAGPKAITAITQPANGTVVTTGGGTGLTYQPDANYCNTQPGGTPDTFTYTLTPGGVDGHRLGDRHLCRRPAGRGQRHRHRARGRRRHRDHGVGQRHRHRRRPDHDQRGHPDPANGTVVITGGGTGLTYQPDRELLQQPARHHPRHVHLHASTAGRRRRCR